MRLIDADDLLEQSARIVADGGMNTTEKIGRIIIAITDAPTVDAVPVVHGWWVRCNGKSNLWYCSECGEKIRYNPSRRTYNIEKRLVQEVHKYCRGCSAKMGGDSHA